MSIESTDDVAGAQDAPTAADAKIAEDAEDFDPECNACVEPERYDDHVHRIKEAKE